MARGSLSRGTWSEWDVSLVKGAVSAPSGDVEQSQHTSMQLKALGKSGWAGAKRGSLDFRFSLLKSYCGNFTLIQK